MRKAIALFAALALMPLAAAAQSAPGEAPKPINPSKIILVGDSTTAVIGGWGPSFCAYHVTSFAAGERASVSLRPRS